MKISTTLHALTVTGSSLLLSSLFALSAHAGPGPQFWQNTNASDKTSLSPALAAVAACPGSERVPITVYRAALPTGRGPLVANQEGTQSICRVCPVISTEITNAWANHRGPLQTKEVAKVGAAHVCATGCAMVKS